jgi:hypothetical protein
MKGLLSCKSPVTAGREVMCGGVVGAGGVGVAGGLSNFAAGVACEACPLAASSLTRTTLELGHLCFLAVLRDSNLRLHASHCRWRVGSLAAFIASRSLSRFEARPLFRARCLFSFWALLALRLPFLSSKKASWPPSHRSSKIYANITFFTLRTG